MELVGLVLLRRVVAEALAGQRVHDHWAAEALGLRQRLLQRRAVVAVDRADVLQAEVLEEPCGARAFMPFLIACRASYAAGPTPGTALSRRLTRSRTAS